MATADAAKPVEMAAGQDFLWIDRAAKTNLETAQTAAAA
jgi:hypothetical protein